MIFLKNLVANTNINMDFEKFTQQTMPSEKTEKNKKTLDLGKFTCGIFVDLRKAFDTVNHQILLNNLELYGILGTPNAWLKSYLNNRKQLAA